MVCKRFAKFVAGAFSNFSIAASASARVRLRYFSRIVVTVLSEWPYQAYGDAVVRMMEPGTPRRIILRHEIVDRSQGSYN